MKMIFKGMVFVLSFLFLKSMQAQEFEKNQVLVINSRITACVYVSGGCPCEDKNTKDLQVYTLCPGDKIKIKRTDLNNGTQVSFEIIKLEWPRCENASQPGGAGGSKSITKDNIKKDGLTFCMFKEYLNGNSDLPKMSYSGLGVATLTLPSKLYYEDVDISRSAFNLGPCISPNFRIGRNQRTKLAPSAFFTYTRLDIEDNNQLSQPVNAFVTGLGVIFEFNNTAQLGVLTGWDIYKFEERVKDKSWLSIAFGLRILDVL